MADIIGDDEFSDILSSGGKRYFFHKEEDGEVKITFKSSITITNPGDTDLLGKEWNPPTQDANGNALLGFNGEPRQPWSKVEAEAEIKGAPSIYAFGGKTSSCLREMIKAMNVEGVKNETLPGTIWSINRLGKWDWSIKYEGKEAPSTSSTKEIKKANSNHFITINKLLQELKEKNEDVSTGVEENKLIQTVVFMTSLKPAEVKAEWDNLIKEGVIVIDNGKVKVL